MVALAASSTAGKLGCGSYEAFMLTRGGRRQLAPIPWATLKWTRVLSETSTGEITATLGADCPSVLREVRPWRHELGLIRDDEEVWVGPIVQPKGPVEQITFSARDLTAWWDHRYIHGDHDFSLGADLADIIRAFHEDAMAPDASPRLELQVFKSGVTAVRKVLALQHQIAGPLIRDLAQTGIQWTTVGRTCTAGVRTPERSAGTILDNHLVAPAVVSLDGTAQANRWIVRGSGGGDQGDTIYGDAIDAAGRNLDGLLESTESVSTIEDYASAQKAATSRVALTGAAVTVEGVQLAPSAPFPIRSLVPGRLYDLKLDWATFPVRERMRLQSVTAEVSSADGDEKVALAFQPVGETSGYRGLRPSDTAARDLQRQILDRLYRLENGGGTRGVVGLDERIRLGLLQVSALEEAGGGGAITFKLRNPLTGATYTILV